MVWSGTGAAFRFRKVCGKLLLDVEDKDEANDEINDQRATSGGRRPTADRDREMREILDFRCTTEKSKEGKGQKSKEQQRARAKKKKR